jgi:hypothetical protein
MSAIKNSQDRYSLGYVPAVQTSEVKVLRNIIEGRRDPVVERGTPMLWDAFLSDYSPMETAP